MIPVEDLRGHLEVPAPLITHFDLSSMRPLDFIDLFRGQADRLQHLRLARVSIPYHSSMLSGLKHLELKDISTGPSISDITRILTASASIHTLILEMFPGQVGTPPEDDHPLELPHLNKLHLVKIDPNYCTSLLNRISIPRCHDFALECSLLGSEAAEAIPFLNRTLGPSFDPLKTIISHLKTSSFDLMANTFTCRQLPLRDPPYAFRLDLVGVPASETLRWVAGAFGPQLSSVAVSISVHNDFATQDPIFLSALESLGRIEAFSAEVGTTLPSTFIDYFGQPIIENGFKRWPLPSLRKLTIIAVQDWNRLLPMVQSRYGLNESSISQQLPLPFEELLVECRNMELLGQPRDIVGVNVLGSAYANFPELAPFQENQGALWFPPAQMTGGNWLPVSWGPMA